MNVMVSSPKREMVKGMTPHVIRIVCHFRASSVASITTTITTGKNHLLSITFWAFVQ